MPQEVPTTAAEHWARWRHEASEPTPPPPVSDRLGRIRYGLAQPFLGLRTIMASGDLLGLSLAPAVAVMVIGVVAGVAMASERGPLEGIVAWWLAIAALAPVPPLLLGRLYAHLAAKARPGLGLVEHEPYRRSLVQLAVEALWQLLVLTLGVLPFTALTGIVPWVGPALALALQGAWTLHWIVVEGYDNARTLPPERTVESLELESRVRPGLPWFHRMHEAVEGARWSYAVLAPARMLSEVVTTLARAWRVEVDLVEERPWISLGFGLGVVVMLAVPGLNLLFRPAVVVGGVHLRHRLLDEPAEARVIVARGGTEPHAVVRA